MLCPWHVCSGCLYGHCQKLLMCICLTQTAGVSHTEGLVLIQIMSAVSPATGVDGLPDLPSCQQAHNGLRLSLRSQPLLQGLRSLSCCCSCCCLGGHNAPHCRPENHMKPAKRQVLPGGLPYTLHGNILLHTMCRVMHELAAVSLLSALLKLVDTLPLWLTADAWGAQSWKSSAENDISGTATIRAAHLQGHTELCLTCPCILQDTEHSLIHQQQADALRLPSTYHILLVVCMLWACLISA